MYTLYENHKKKLPRGHLTDLSCLLSSLEGRHSMETRVSMGLFLQEISSCSSRLRRRLSFLEPLSCIPFTAKTFLWWRHEDDDPLDLVSKSCFGSHFHSSCLYNDFYFFSASLQVKRVESSLMVTLFLSNATQNRHWSWRKNEVAISICSSQGCFGLKFDLLFSVDCPFNDLFRHKKWKKSVKNQPKSWLNIHVMSQLEEGSEAVGWHECLYGQQFIRLDTQETSWRDQIQEKRQDRGNNNHKNKREKEKVSKRFQ